MLLDQIPNEIYEKDVTLDLKDDGFFASVNIPSVKSVYDKSKLLEREKQIGDGFYKFGENIRYRMYEKRQGTITDLRTLQKVMRYNDFEHDELSEFKNLRSASKAISTRRDLNKLGVSYGDPNYGFHVTGGTDAKLVDLHLIENLEVMATSGPTSDDQPAFQWSALNEEQKKKCLGGHDLHPDVFDFQPQKINFAQSPNQVQVDYQ